jgi:hypothetical protein
VGNDSVARSTRPVVPTPAIFSLSRSGERRRLTAGADAEDVVEKLPLTPAPIVPALDQLRELLLRLGRLEGSDDRVRRRPGFSARSPGRLSRRGRCDGPHWIAHPRLKLTGDEVDKLKLQYVFCGSLLRGL